MSLVSITYQVFQKPTHRRILFTATDHLGGTHTFGPVITVDGSYDPEVVKTAIQNKIEKTLGNNEVDRWMEDTEAPVTTVHATKEQYAAALRSAYLEAEKEEAWRIAYKIYSRYQAGDFTAAQLRTAFGMSQVEFQAFAIRVQQGHDKWVELQGAKGE